MGDPEERARLLGKFLADRKAACGGSPYTIRPRAAKGPAPLSFPQQRLWFISRLEPENPLYNTPTAFRIKGSLRLPALRQAIAAVGRRHEILRTVYTECAGEPVQEVALDRNLKAATVDLSGRPSANRDAEAEELLQIEARRPFDLQRDLPCRVTLLRLAETDHILLIVTHHIASDGWSRGILFREISHYYEAFCGGKPAALPDLPIQYADFAAWQRGHFRDSRLEDHLRYWERQLAGAPPLLQLPADKPRPAIERYRGAASQFVIPRRVLDALQSLSAEAECTLFMTLLAAFKTLLYRYTGQPDLTVGTPTAGRSWIETENLIGFFVNTLAIRSDLSNDPTFSQLLPRIREVCLQAYAHQDLPYEKLIERLQPERNLSYSPIFQVMFVLQSSPGGSLALPGLKVSPVAIQTGTSKFDLALSLEKNDNGLSGTFEYNTDLFEAETIERIIGHFKVLLEGIAANPGQKISQLPLLTPAERRQIVIDWNDTTADYPADSCIHELFEAQAKLTPEAVAVVFENQTLTYRELDDRAERLALRLKEHGVGPEALVGIFMERSPDMIVGLLGILKAGAAYVPLDPSNPKDRLALILNEARPVVILAQPGLSHTLPTTAAEVIEPDPSWTTARGTSPVQRSSERYNSENRAYVIFTSGSTGTPKGVQVTHRAAVNCLSCFERRLEIKAGDAVLAATTLSFDISVLEIFLPLCTGAKIVLARRETAADGTKLRALIERHCPNVIQATPAGWRLLLESGWKGMKGLKALCGGEAFPPDLLPSLLERADRVWNLYGPTETTVWSACAELTRPGGRPIPIGRPIDNTQIYILDSTLQPVPVGVPGEIYIGGEGLARGYLNRPELTAERFIPNPFSRRPGARLYRTGDTARYRPDGNIEFLGRADDQVKIRGFRIELGEIESTLVQHRGVRAAVAAVREDRPGDRRLVAYVVPDPNAPAPAIAELRAFLQQKLPEYMIPSAFEFLASLPLAPGGKVNRRALPAPNPDRPELTGYSAPRTPLEEILTGIWAEVLGVDRVGIHDNFFELGGHSLLATKVVSQIRRLLQIEIPLRRMFETPTVAGLAALLPEDALMDTLAELEHMSEEDAQTKLADMEAPDA